MASALVRALEQLYQGPLPDFTRERDRLAAELRKSDRSAAAEIARRRRPTLSAWAVNQLYWRDRGSFDAMLRTAACVRGGDLAASREHHDAIAALRKRAAEILEAAGHPAGDATLRRVATTLAAISAAGSFDPDPPGALAADRDPPGFSALGVPEEAAAGEDDGKAAAPGTAAPKHGRGPRGAATRSSANPLAAREASTDARAAAQRRRADERMRRRSDASRRHDERERKRAEGERKRADREHERRERDRQRAEEKRLRAERAGRRTERSRLQKQLRDARAALRDAEERATALDRRLRDARSRADDARAAVEALERRLAALSD